MTVTKAIPGTKPGRQSLGLSQNIIRIRTQQLQARKLHAQSEYQERYKQWPWQPPVKSIKPKSQNNKNQPMYGPNSGSDMKTTTQISFGPHKPQTRTKSHAPKREYKRDKTKMITDTTYDIDYTHKEANRRLPCKPAEQNVSSNKPFTHRTAYEATYVKRTPEELADCKSEVKKPTDNLHVVQVRFAGTSTVQNDFKPHENVQPAASMRPPEKSYTSTTPFKAQTTHQTDFAPKPPQKPREAFKPEEQPRSSSTVGRFDYLTIMKRDFPEHAGHKPEGNYKPKQDYKPGPKFVGKTTQSMAYTPWPIPPREKLPWARRNSYNPCRAKLRVKTTYQDDYTDPSCIIPEAWDKCRPAPCRYENNLGAGESGPFDDRTEYKSTYIAWDGAKRAGTYKITEEYQPPKTKFTGESIFCSHFKGERAPPAKSCRPPRRIHSSEGKSMHLETTYRKNYRRPVSCSMIEMLGLDEGAVSDREDDKAVPRPWSADK